MKCAATISEAETLCSVVHHRKNPAGRPDEGLSASP
jgi:hypothetical protein